MARYQVDVRVGPTPVYRTRLRAASHEGAQQIARSELFLSGVVPAMPYVMTVRRRGLRRRAVTYAGGLPPGGPDPAGVREPRRPSPPPPSLRAARDEPA
jgi:hypothetical protein